eukprot:TRINITY_DN1817_c0_g1_i1.p1 TRINITY_DN1817_c0_g1~~TRINITY_DN1817_c0_g1_i1.p1  ORF type:complete len:175 (+),score=39.47 TRINITY_DN1817_c0_g1_i1:362-886(+)
MDYKDNFISFRRDSLIVDKENYENYNYEFEYFSFYISRILFENKENIIMEKNQIKAELEKKIGIHLKTESKFEWTSRAEKVLDSGLEILDGIKKNEKINFRFNEPLYETEDECNYEIKSDQKPDKAICIIPAFYLKDNILTYGRLSDKKNDLAKFDINFEYIILKQKNGFCIAW